jgi:hypothetical protein
MIGLVVGARAIRADVGTCNGVSITLPFTDVQTSNIFFCSIAEAYFSGLTNGTSATTYNPSDPVPREQMAAFITRTLDQSLKRGSRRAALNQWWNPISLAAIHAISLSPTASPEFIVCDGHDLWVSDISGNVFRVQASDNKLLGTWTGATGARGIIAANGRIFIASVQGKIYAIDPDSSPAPVELLEDSIGVGCYGITFDGANLWTANSTSGSISRVHAVTAVDSTFTGFNSPVHILWDGANLWVSDTQLKRVDPTSGSILETVPFNAAGFLQFDGSNLWVTSYIDNSVTVVRAVGAFRGTVLATLTGNGVHHPYGIAFDGERILVCNNGGTDTVSLFNATDFSPLGIVSVGFGADPYAACSDGMNFWIVRSSKHDIVRY